MKQRSTKRSGSCPRPPTRTCAPLRRLIRKYYAKTRDGQGNVEEALRFINHAAASCPTPSAASATTRSSRCRPARRRRIAHVVSNAVAEAGEQTDVEKIEEPLHLKSQEAMDDELETGLDADEPPAEQHPHHPGLTERVASFGRSPIVTIGLCAFFGAFIAAAIVFVTPADTILVAKQVLVWLTITLLGLTLIYGAVHGIAYMRRRRGSPGAGSCRRPTSRSSTGGARKACSSAPTSRRRIELDLPVAHGRARARQVGPHQRAASVAAPCRAHLRLCDLGSRARAPAVGAARPRPCCRATSRSGSAIRWSRRCSSPAAGCRSRRFSSRPLEPRRASGCSASSCSSRSPMRTRGATRAQLDRALRRSFRVVGGHRLRLPCTGALIAVAYEKLAQNQETDWDFAQDVLVTHGPPGVLNTVTGVCGLPRCSGCTAWRGTSRWRNRSRARTTIAEAIPSANTLGGFAGAAGAFPACRRHLRRRYPAACARHRTGARAAVPAAPVPPPAVRASARSPRFLRPCRRPHHRRPPRARPTRSDRHRSRDRVCQRKAKVAIVSAEAAHVEGRQLAPRGRAVQGMDRARARHTQTYRCLGNALQAQGYHQDAITAFRKAKQYDPSDRSLDAAIDRSQGHRGRILEQIPPLIEGTAARTGALRTARAAAYVRRASTKLR